MSDVTIAQMIQQANKYEHNKALLEQGAIGNLFRRDLILKAHNEIVVVNKLVKKI